MAENFPLDPAYLIKNEAELRALFPPTHPIAITKCLKKIDKHTADFIARSPFLCLGTQTPDGQADVSPRGDPCGFVKILDDQTLLIPDRPGNNRLDTLSNITANPAVGILFIIPGFDETIRINGTAQLTRDPALLEKLTVQDRQPTVAIILHIDEIFIHCAKAFRRAKLWDATQHQDRKEMPSLIQIVLDQTTGAPNDRAEQKALDDGLEADYKNTMY